jgi:hypothetical protein
VAKPNYQFEKRQRENEKKKKKAEKAQKKAFAADAPPETSEVVPAEQIEVDSACQNPPLST